MDFLEKEQTTSQQATTAPSHPKPVYVDNNG
jgi:hypothetical protein